MIERTFGDLVEKACAAYAREEALVDATRRMTYAEVLSGVRRTGRALRSYGIDKGRRVGILMADSADLPIVQYGALWAGLEITPMNAKLGAEEQAYILEDSGVEVLVHDATHAERAAQITRIAGTPRTLATSAEAVLDGGAEIGRLAARESDAPLSSPAAAPDDLAAIYYTGGTTGVPKGVAHSHRTLIAAICNELLDMGLGEREVFGHVAPLTHGSGMFVLPTWMRGGRNVVLGGFDPERFLDGVEREGITATMMVPTMIYVLLDVPGVADRDTSNLATIVYGAAPMGRERLLQGIDTFGPVFSQLYGQTEAPNQLTVLTKADHADAVARGDHDVLSSCGREVSIAQVRIADDDMTTVPTGEVGEIVGRGPHIMLGYWNKPEETEATIRDGWLCTGDLARMDERGLVTIVDRKKDMIISGGFNVYPKDVERALFGHPAVRDVCVIGVPDEKWGEAVKAVVVLEEGAPGEAELIAFCKEKVGSVIAPKTIDVVDSIPLTAVGKHDKPALRASYWQGRDRAVN